MQQFLLQQQIFQCVPACNMSQQLPKLHATVFGLEHSSISCNLLQLTFPVHQIRGQIHVPAACVNIKKGHCFTCLALIRKTSLMLKRRMLVNYLKNGNEKGPLEHNIWRLTHKKKTLNSLLLFKTSRHILSGHSLQEKSWKIAWGKSHATSCLVCIGHKSF